MYKRQALKSEVEDSGGASTIEVEAGTYTCSSDCYDGDSMLYISRSVNIAAKDGDGTAVLDGGGARRIIYISTSGITVGLTGLNIMNGRAKVRSLLHASSLNVHPSHCLSFP